MSLDDWLAGHRSRRRAAGLERRLRNEGPDAGLSGGDPPVVVDLASNDYLGLRTDPRVVQAAAAAARSCGAGAGASRLVTGSFDVHRRLEAALARFTGRPAGLVFSSGYAANLGAVSALTDRETLLVSDSHVHASLVDACRLARAARVQVTPHCDLCAVERALRERDEPRALVLVESVYSVDGDAAPLPELAAVCARYDAVLVVDEAHALGVAGPGGRGLTAAADLAPRSDVVVTATLSKALGSQGGAVLASRAVIDHLINAARSFVYDTALAPPAAAAALRSIEILEEDPDLPARARAAARRLAGSLGVEIPPAAVLSLPMAGPDAAVRAAADLAAEGIRVGCFRPPSVPDGRSRLRLTAGAGLTASQLDAAADRLAAVPERA